MKNTDSKKSTSKKGAKSSQATAQKAAPATEHKAVAVHAPKKVVAIQKERPEDEFSDSFLKAAKRLDEKIRGLVDRIGRDVVTLGELCLEMKDKTYYAALGFPTAADYFNAAMPQGVGKSQAFQAMRIVRSLTTGVDGQPPAVSKADVLAMSKENAEGLAKLQERDIPITPTMIQQAKELPIKRFQDEIVLPNAPDLAQREAAGRGETLANRPTVMMTVKRELPSDIYAEDQRCMEIARWLVRDDDRKIPLDEKAYAAILAEFRATYEAEYEAARVDAANESMQRARQTDARDHATDSTLDEEEEEEVSNVIPEPNISAAVIEQKGAARESFTERVIELDAEGVSAA